MSRSADWFTGPPPWPPTLKTLVLAPENAPKPPPDVSLTEIMSNSAKFPVKFPVESVRCSQLLQNKIPQTTLEANANSAYPVLHEHALHLCTIFLNYQKKNGNKFYKKMSLLELIDRLLSKRAVSFVGALDAYLLLDGSSGVNKWETIGTKKEKFPLVLDNCLSYDEIRLAALVSVSSHTVFLNDGSRQNEGKFENERENIQDGGVIIGLVGPRLHKRKVMECREIIRSKEQNIKKFGYGKKSLQSEFLDFYGDFNTTYNSKLIETNKDRYVKLLPDTYFDKLMYERRLILSIDTLLIEANSRAKILNKMAYVHVVGLGLGVWKIYAQQDEIFIKTFIRRLEILTLDHISDVCFSHIKYKMADVPQNGHITLHFKDRNPHSKIPEKLLVVSYPWDGNAFPGNEFWWGSLWTSGDPACACSTQVAELHNCCINPKVTAWNLRVATLNGLVTFDEYREKLTKETC
ncbi:uncharacterized protein LOC123008834 [Tribolium madens]|uniref:uncharacterized protein LOC123008834 n=1 Tax=Tribolium madens TaxID=41895 RepID=UPI001CF722F2|nr:uncharacterized protein LOC123008834 [Tribolium madens]